MGQLADSFLLASGKLQALCYKADIEAALRTPGFEGFQLLDLHDFPGQGTALVGVLNAFWDEKRVHLTQRIQQVLQLNRSARPNEKNAFSSTVKILKPPSKSPILGDTPLLGCTPRMEDFGSVGRNDKNLVNYQPSTIPHRQLH